MVVDYEFLVADLSLYELHSVNKIKFNCENAEIRVRK